MNEEQMQKPAPMTIGVQAQEQVQEIKFNQSFSEGVHWTTIQLLNQAAFLL